MDRAKLFTVKTTLYGLLSTCAFAEPLPSKYPGAVSDRITEQSTEAQEQASRKAAQKEALAKSGMVFGLGAFLAGYASGTCGFYYLIADGDAGARTLVQRYRGRAFGITGSLLMAIGAAQLYEKAGDWEDAQEAKREVRSKESFYPLLKERYGETGAKQFADHYFGEMRADEFIETFASTQRKDSIQKSLEEIRRSIHNQLAKREMDSRVLKALEDQMVKERALPFLLSEEPELSPVWIRLNRQLESAQRDFFSSARGPKS